MGGGDGGHELRSNRVEVDHDPLFRFFEFAKTSSSVRYLPCGIENYRLATCDLRKFRHSLPRQKPRNLLDKLETAAQAPAPDAAPSGEPVKSQSKRHDRLLDSIYDDAPTFTASPPSPHTRSKIAARGAQRASHVGEAERSKQRPAGGPKHVRFSSAPILTAPQEDLPNTAF
jgi:hypothetical protein